MGSNDALDFILFPTILSPFILLKISGKEDLAFFHWILTPVRRCCSQPHCEHFKVISFSLSEQHRLLRAKFVSPSYFEYAGRVQGIREGTKSWREFFFLPTKASVRSRLDGCNNTLTVIIESFLFFLHYKLKTKLIYAIGIIFFLWRFLRFITYGIK